MELAWVINLYSKWSLPDIRRLDQPHSSFSPKHNFSNFKMVGRTKAPANERHHFKWHMVGWLMARYFKNLKLLIHSFRLKPISGLKLIMI